MARVTDHPVIRKVSEIGRALADHPLMRRMHEYERKLRDHPVMREAAEEAQRRVPSPPRKRKRGRRRKLTPARSPTASRAPVRRAEVAHHKKHSTLPFTQTEAIKVLRREMRRDGKPMIKVSRSTWPRHIVWPALGRD